MLNMKPIFLRAARLLTTLSLVVAVPAMADTYPSRTIKLVTPLAAGGPSDALARSLADGLRTELNQTVIVENRAGAGGTIGVGSTVNSPADGYTMVLGGKGTLVFAEGAYNLKYSVLKDLRPIALVAAAPAAIAVRSNLGVNNLQELIQRAKKSPSLTYGTPGVGSVLHLAGVLFEQLTGSKLVHVPYKGLTPALTDLQAGTVDIVFANVASLAPFIQSGKMKVLAVIDDKASPQLPGVPTSTAAGLPGLVADTWYGVMVPAGVPDPVAKRLEAAVAATLKREDFQKNMQAQGFNLESDPSAAKFARVLKRDHDLWVPMIKKLNLPAS